MRLDFRPFRATALVLALVGLAACDDSSGSGSNLDGSYDLTAATISETGERVPLPGILYEGSVTDGGTTFNVREEVLNSSIDFDGDDREYTFTAQFRISETSNRFPAEVVTLTERGSYRVNGSTISFTVDDDSPDFVLNDGTGSLDDGTVFVDVSDPFFDDDLVFEFDR